MTEPKKTRVSVKFSNPILYRVAKEHEKFSALNRELTVYVERNQVSISLKNGDVENHFTWSKNELKDFVNALLNTEDAIDDAARLGYIKRKS